MSSANSGQVARHRRAVVTTRRRHKAAAKRRAQHRKPTPTISDRLRATGVSARTGAASVAVVSVGLVGVASATPASAAPAASGGGAGQAPAVVLQVQVPTAADGAAASGGAAPFGPAAPFQSYTITLPGVTAQPQVLTPAAPVPSNGQPLGPNEGSTSSRDISTTPGAAPPAPLLPPGPASSESGGEPTGRSTSTVLGIDGLVGGVTTAQGRDGTAEAGVVLGAGTPGGGIEISNETPGAPGLHGGFVASGSLGIPWTSLSVGASSQVDVIGNGDESKAAVTVTGPAGTWLAKQFGFTMPETAPNGSELPGMSAGVRFNYDNVHGWTAHPVAALGTDNAYVAAWGSYATPPTAPAPGPAAPATGSTPSVDPVTGAPTDLWGQMTFQPGPAQPFPDPPAAQTTTPDQTTTPAWPSGPIAPVYLPGTGTGLPGTPVTTAGSTTSPNVLPGTPSDLWGQMTVQPGPAQPFPDLPAAGAAQPGSAAGSDTAPQTPTGAASGTPAGTATDTVTPSVAPAAIPPANPAPAAVTPDQPTVNAPVIPPPLDNPVTDTGNGGSLSGTGISGSSIGSTGIDTVAPGPASTGISGSSTGSTGIDTVAPGPIDTGTSSIGSPSGSDSSSLGGLNTGTDLGGSLGGAADGGSAGGDGGGGGD